MSNNSVVNKLKQLLSRISALWRISRLYDSDIRNLERLVSKLDDRIGEHTVVHADIHWKYRAHQIIVVGQWRDRDYVRVFSMEVRDWDSLVETLHDIERNAKVGRFDVPHSVPFSVVYKHDRL